MSSRELVKGLFQFRELPRVPFVPWLCSFAAQLEQVRVEEMLSDAGLLSRSLINTQKLFGYDAIVNVFDPSLEAEACGCRVEWNEDEGLPRVASHPLAEGASLEDLDILNFEKRGRLPAILDGTRRIKTIRGREVAIIGVITGPLTLARHLRDDPFLTDLNQNTEDAAKVVATAGNIGLKLCRIYCELGVDVVAIADDMMGLVNPSLLSILAAPLRSIWNVAKFYNVNTLIVSRGCSEGHIEPIIGFQADGVALSGSIDFLKLREAALKGSCCYSRSFPDSVFLGSASQIDSFAADYPSMNGKGLFISTEWEVPYTTNVNNLHEVMRIIHNNQES